MDILPSFTAWYNLPEGSRNDIRAEITHACAEVMRATGDNPMTSPAVKTAQLEMITRIGGHLGYAIERPEAEEMLQGWNYYSADQERIQHNGKLFGSHIAEAVGNPISHWWAEEYTRRIGWLAADTLNKKAKAANDEKDKKAEEEDPLQQHAEVFRLIARMNQMYPHFGQVTDPEFTKLTEEVKTALAHTAVDSPERDALMSTYHRMMHLPTHQEDSKEDAPGKNTDTDSYDVLQFFR